jgi:hypothetical protein
MLPDLAGDGPVLAEPPNLDSRMPLGLVLAREAGECLLRKVEARSSLVPSRPKHGEAGARRA